MGYPQDTHNRSRTAKPERHATRTAAFIEENGTPRRLSNTPDEPLMKAWRRQDRTLMREKGGQKRLPPYRRGEGEETAAMPLENTAAAEKEKAS